MKREETSNLISKTELDIIRNLTKITTPEQNDLTFLIVAFT